MATIRMLTNTGSPLIDPDGTLAAGTRITFDLVTAISHRAIDAWDATTLERITGYPITVELDATACFPVDTNNDPSFGLWPNDRGNVATVYRCCTDTPNTKPFYAAMPSGATPITWAEFFASGTPLTSQELSALAIHESQVGIHIPSGGTSGQVLAKHSATNNDVEWVTQTGGGGGDYTLPIASDTILGGVKIGSGVSIDGNGTITVTASGSGDVVGPFSATADHFASYNTTTGKLIKDSGVGASDFATAAQGTDVRTPTTHGSDKHSVTYLVSGTATASDVGAVSKSGDTMTGTLVGKASDSGTDRFYNIHVGTSAPSDTSMLFLDTSV